MEIKQTTIDKLLLVIENCGVRDESYVQSINYSGCADCFATCKNRCMASCVNGCTFVIKNGI